MRRDDPWAQGTREPADERELADMFEKQIDDMHARAEFAKINRRQWASLVVVLAAMGLFAVADPASPLPFALDLPRERVSGFAFGLILSCIGFSFWNWRCPNCHKSLGRGMFPRYCAKCGVRLK